MEIPVGAQVECTDGLCGHVAYVLINPVIEQVTHLVVREDALPNAEYIVPVEVLAETVADTIRLRCSKAELKRMDPFVKTEFVQAKVPDVYPEFGAYGGMGTYYWPYVGYERTVQVPVEHLQIPPGELAVRRGTRAKATDGDVGRVDEFVVNSENGHITHLVMREGHLWGQKDVIIPVSAIDKTEEDTVFLKLDKRQIEALPTFPVHRRWA
ncbi:MAG: PRC-barrel domain-containing protein [Anaerolineae bacterium]